MKPNHLLPAILVVAGMCHLLQAQPFDKAQDGPGVLWSRTYGGGSEDIGYSVQQTSDGGFVVAGCTQSFGAGLNDVWLIRTDAYGDTLWTRTFGGSESDNGYSVQVTSDSGFVVAGNTNSFGEGDLDVYLIRTDANGDTLWTRTYGGSSSDYGYSVQQTSDSGFVVAGYTQSFGAGLNDVWLIRTDAYGDTLWTRTYGGDSWDYGYSVQQTIDSGFVVAGHTHSFGAGVSDAWLVRTNPSGDTLWTRTYGGSSSDYGYSVQQTSDGGFVVAGYTGSFGAGGSDVYLIRTNANGDTLWTRTYGGSRFDMGSSVQQTSDSGFVVAGYTESFGAGGEDAWLIKTDADGNREWSRTFGGSSYDEEDEGLSVQLTADGGYIVTGYTYSFSDYNYNVWLIRLGEGGMLQEPIIAAVTDIPEDQGHRVYLSWSASYHDLFEIISQYGIKLQNPEGQWVSLGSVAAEQAETYTYLAATFGDSTAYGLTWSRFQVTAHTEKSALYYTSPMDSGYSIDNLAPAAPTGLLVSVTEGPAVSLAWNGPVDHDFDFFRVYRQADDDTAAVSLAETPESAFTDNTVEKGRGYDYWLSALDGNGNESGYSQAVSVTALGTEEAPGLPTAFALHQNYPNPFNPATTIRFALPEGTKVLLVVYDLQGREAARLLDSDWPAGDHHVVWDGQLANGQAAPSGIYIARLTTPTYAKSIKLILLR